MIVKTEKDVSAETNDNVDIAIIGLWGVFPGSPSPDKFWENLIADKDLISEIPTDRWDFASYYGDGENQTRVKWGGFINGVDEFDAKFFNISRREAELMDPQQRILIETIWKTIENSGYTQADLAACKTGLFVGASTVDYEDLIRQANHLSAYVPTGTFHSILANRISYLFDLHGPSAPVDTACSSSLVAIHKAVKAIQNEDCDVAIAGGVNALIAPNIFIEFNKAGMLSKDGRCKTFDKSADGYVRGEGAGAILLKPLNKAIADGDKIYAVIKGTAVNHGGHVNSLTVPNPNAQAEVISKAIERAQVPIETITYIEAHGTGTSLGDPIEINGLKKAFRIMQEKQGQHSLPSHYCGLGSVKTNIGHLEAAAGMAGIIKVLLAMQAGQLPGILHLKQVNPYIDINNSPFYIIDKNTEWQRLKDKNGNIIPRRAGISSFGFGGANAHILLEEPPAIMPPKHVIKPYYLITLSAKTAESLNQLISDLAVFTASHKNISLENLSFTLNIGRTHFKKRLAVVVKTLDELTQTLQQLQLNTIPSNAFVTFEDVKPIDKSNLSKFIEQLATLTTLPENQYREALLQFAKSYTEGYMFDWQVLHQGEAKQRIAAPTYPFAREKYWLPKIETTPVTPTITTAPVVNLNKDPPILDKTPVSIEPTIHQTSAPHVNVISPQIELSSTDIAVIGMSGIFPNSADLDEFWQNLMTKKDLISEIPSNRWDWRDYYGEGEDKTKIKWGGFINGIDEFDLAFFSISPHEAQRMDPQQRLFLQTVWKTMEDAGYTKEQLSTIKTGIFVGVASADYAELLQKSNDVSAYSLIGTQHSVLVNRVSYLLDIKGPSEAIDAACSSSLIAIHHAVQSLQLGDCEMAFAAGAHAILNPIHYLEFSNAGMLSEDGRCKTFDKSANGYVRGEGVGVILLKPLKKALADQDTIYGVIKGSAINHGGHVSSLTVPNPNAQAEVIATALKRANFSADTISYIEAHGTGTSLGDPIEINGLKKAFKDNLAQHGKESNSHGYCGVGSVKTNIGHLETAAGIAGVIKILLAMQHGKLPGILHFNELNPYIQLKDSPFYVVTETQDWQRLTTADGGVMPRRAGVSSFGFGGTNAHIVLEEAPSKAQTASISKPYYIFTLSAKTDIALTQKIIDLAAWIDKHEQFSLAKMSYTLNIARSHFDKRCAFVAGSIQELKETLRQLTNKQIPANAFINMKKESKDDTGKNQINQSLQILNQGQLSVENYKEQLLTIANFYTKGHAIDWQQLHHDGKERLSLPTYPFAKDRWWLPEKVSMQMKDAEIKTPTNIPKSNDANYYHPIWKPEPLIENKKTAPAGPILVFDKDEKVVQRLREKYPQTTILQVLLKDTYHVMGSDMYQIDISHSQDYLRVLDELKQKQLLPKIILLHPNINPHAAINQQLRQSYYPLFYLTKALLQHKWKDEVQVLCINEVTDDAALPFGEALAGFAKTLHLEHPKINARTIEIPVNLDIETILAELNTQEVELRYDKTGIRYIKHYQNVDPSQAENQNELLKKNGVYLITGGAGGLGLIFANYLAEHYQAKLVLTGRSALDEEKITSISKLEQLGSEVIYVRGDITKPTDVMNLLKTIKTKWQKINGIIHSAGILRDAFILNKTPEECADVFAPKIAGTILLDNVTQKEPLDFFLKFSSIASVFGNVGQCDYAYANSFIDAFADYRTRLLKQNQRFGKTISINWPLWSEGGMQIDKTLIERMTKNFGIHPISINEGIDAFKAALNLSHQRLVVVKGDNNQIKSKLQMQKATANTKSTVNTNNTKPSSKDASLTPLEKELLVLFAKDLNFKEEDLDIHAPLTSYGLDSIMMIGVLDKVEETYGQIVEPTALIDNTTIHLFAKYLAGLGVAPKNGSSPSIQALASKETLSDSLAAPTKLNDHVMAAPQVREKQNLNTTKIAVIGMAGRFPGSPNLESFWDNLRQGRELISEIPEERFSLDDYFSADKKAAKKSYSKWGGFIDDIALFAADFFGVTPEDAIMIDPPQRLLLELTQELLDRSGYKREALHSQKVGVMIGGGTSFYHQFYKPAILNEWLDHIVVNSIQNMLSARIADFYNLAGPAFSIDTACSSSLVAVHQACQSLLTGESDLVIAGGAELLISPEAHINFSKAGVLSDDGKSYVFDKRAKGFVLGEGVGLVLLKKYEDAIQDGDMILGVILASAINNDGHTAGLTVPNLKAQQAVIQTALAKSAIQPQTVGYYEAHGTGTLLGDPIEIKAMTEIYRRYTDQKGYCAVGSVKSNIGHTLRAAGVASLIKVLLAMQHKEIPPTLNCEQPHPRFNFAESPFYPVTKVTPWPAIEGVRRAAISSFGFGGTNCHLILEEHHAEDGVSTRKPLPTTVLERKRYWLGDTAALPASNHDQTNVKQPTEAAKTGLVTEIIEHKQAAIVADGTQTNLQSAITKFLLDKLSPLFAGKNITVDIKKNLMEFGIDSTDLINLTMEIEQEANIELYPTLFFEYQTVYDLSCYFAAEHAAAFATLLKVSEQVEAAAPAIPSISIKIEEPVKEGNMLTTLPLSLGQERLWFINNLHPNTSDYNIGFACLINGDLDQNTLFDACREITYRHDSLRMVFPQHNGQPYIKMLSNPDINPVVIDCQMFVEGNVKQEIEKVFREQIRQPFNIEQGPLVRYVLVRFSPQQSAFIFIIHHIISDGWSIGIFIKELADFYNSLIHHRLLALPPPLTYQYHDFIAWQQKTLENKLPAIMGYWKNKLADLPILNLPTDHPRGADMPMMETYELKFPKGISQQLRDLTAAQKTTIFNLLFAAYCSLLYRYSGQEDFTVGIPFHGRDKNKSSNIIGFFINMLPIRVNVTGDMIFSTLIKQIMQSTIEAVNHQEIPLAKLVSELKLPRFANRESLFSVTFVLEQFPLLASEFENMQLSPIAVDVGRPPYDMTFAVHTYEEEFFVEVAYDANIFKRNTIERLAKQWLQILQSVTQEFNQPIKALSLLTPEEQKKMVFDWNQTAVDYSRDKTIHQLFEEQVEKTPDHIAVVYANEKITYQELNKRANQLAHYLKHLGLGPDKLAAICIGRSIEFMVGMLGILKAGAAYVPLDPNYPPERLEYMLQDSQATILLTQTAFSSLFANSHTNIVDVDKLDLAGQPQTNIPSGNANQLAYIIYTSGSTGKPKGVAIEHASLVNYTKWYHDSFKINENDRSSQYAGISFDASVLEIFPAITSGAALHIIEDACKLEITKLCEYFNEQQISIAFLPTPILEPFTKIKNHYLRTMTVGGDRLVHYTKQTYNTYNLYGPTENTICASVFTLDQSYDSPPIGKPISNVKLYILDTNLNPVPVGVPGELYIGGKQLARGYLNRPELTAEKFIPNPFSPGERMYKTGDLCKWLEDGNIEFIGRVDFQVKIRGFRIEVGEIESVLTEHPAVKKAAVIPRQEQSGETRLVAYWIPNDANTPPSSNELVEFLKRRLPDYMVPSAFVMMEAFPISHNGKLDRKALPAPEYVTTTHYKAPRDEVETTLTKIWSKLLGIKQVGIQDNFFDLGGHSLLAVQLAHEIQQVLGLSLPVASIFSLPTIEEIAELFKNKVPQTQQSPLVPIQTKGSLPALFAIHALGGNVLCYFELSRQLGDNQPFYGLQQINSNETDQTLVMMASKYIEEIRKIQPQGPYHLVGWSFGGILAHEIAHQLEQQGEQIAFLGLIDSALPKDIPAMEDLDEIDALMYFAHDIAGRSSIQLDLHREELSVIASEKRFEYLFEKIKQAGLLPDAVSVDAFKQLFVKCMQMIAKGKQHHPHPIKISIIYFNASSKEFEYTKNSQDWAAYTKGEFEVYELEGNHYSILSSPKLAEQIAKAMVSRRNSMQRNQPAQQPHMGGMVN